MQNLSMICGEALAPFRLITDSLVRLKCGLVGWLALSQQSESIYRRISKTTP
jgi:hypothetical protein